MEQNKKTSNTPLKKWFDNLEQNKNIPKIISRWTGFGVEHFYEGPQKFKPVGKVYDRLVQENEEIIRSNDITTKLTVYIGKNN